MSTPCPSCGAASSGRFCDSCGVALNATCRECQNPLPAGARFCNQCGASVTALPASARPSRLPWAVAGVAVAALLAFVVVPRLNEPAETAPAPLAQAAPAAGDPRAIDLSSMTPRERADRLFNRVMEQNSQGDTTQLGLFTEMAIQAYGMVPAPERDPDLRWHVAELHRLRGEGADVRALADTILAGDPEHLFGLFTAAIGRRMDGDDAGAAVYFRKFLAAYPGQVSRDLPEYREHQPALPSMRAEAERSLAEQR